MGTIFSSEETDPPPPTRPGKQGSRPAHYPLNSLAARVSCKLEEGDFRGAVRLICSEDSIAELDEVTLAALRSKHPPPHPNSCIPPVPEEFAPAIQVSEEEIAHAISSFPNGSSGGPDGLRPQHLKDLISTSAERGGRELLRALTSFVNLVLDGKTPPSARPFFFGATLIPLGKKGGGIRPIAVGHTLHRLVAKCASSVILPSLGNLLAPLQLGCGTPMGCEAMVHAARQFVHNLIPGQMLLKLDFKNTFNCLRRDKMLMTVRESIPELFRFVHSAYAQTSPLFCTDQVVESSEGVQQGDPLDPMLFCLTIHPTVEKLRSELKVFYLDDGTLGDNLQDITRDLQLVEKEAAELGLQLNRSKSELLCEDPTTRDQLLKVVPGLQVIGMDQVEILGSPVGSMTSVDVVINEKIRLLELLGERLRLLQAQDALLLLRHSLAILKVLHVLRSSPCFASTLLSDFDDLLRDILSDVINVRLELGPAWLQASLPVHAGGIGIRSAAQLAPSAYLASAAGCADLVHQILPPRLQDTTNPCVECAMTTWSQGHSQAPPTPPTTHRQRAWDAPRIEALQRTLLESSRDPTTRARLLVVATKESGAWLNALPVPPWACASTMRWSELQLAFAWACPSAALTNAPTVKLK